ncbi:beta-ketoacyl-ACP synthase III [Acidiferrobacter sp.]|uniref:beta-ketoacyl-ACP synthase III n=1 Tax=Acidiferrobacter sp. TaxID=1872107 RepID=UPI0026344FB9|nr:beta-ketoacyl-ACP synthase III [Acidiferrobacter sp.]
MTYARILGTGSFLPARVVTNANLASTVDTSDEWVVSRTGIRERRIAGPGETTCDLAERAARQALDASGCLASEIDLVIVATTTPDRVFPGTACLLQERLGIHGPAAFDVQAVCTGFVYALTIAEKFIRAGGTKRALVVGAETMSRIVDWNDRSTCVLFGDGAGAVVVGASNEPGILSSHLHADGAYKELLTVSTGVSERGPATGRITMRGNEVFRMAVTTLDALVGETLAANNMKQTDIRWLVPHQANIRIIAATAKRLGMAMDQVIVTVDRHGNTSAASIPLAFDSGVRDGRIQRGDVVLMEAFGGGLTWGSVLLRY